MQQPESSNSQKSMPQTASIESIPIDELKSGSAMPQVEIAIPENGYMNFWLRESTE